MVDRIIEVLKSQIAFSAFGPASEEQVAEAEIALGVRFAEDYRTYVLAFGAASCYGHEFTGVCRSPRLDVVTVTKELREIYPDVPGNYYVVEEGHIDGIVIWQAPSGAIYKAVPYTVPTRIASSLAEYILEDGAMSSSGAGEGCFI